MVWYVHEYNNGKNAMGVTYHFLILFKYPQQEEAQALYYEFCQEVIVVRFISPWVTLLLFIC